MKYKWTFYKRNVAVAEHLLRNALAGCDAIEDGGKVFRHTRPG